MLSDIEIAQSATLEPITDIAAKVGLGPDDIEQYGKYKAKVPVEAVERKGGKNGKLVLVTGISPTAAGEGKSTVAVGLADALAIRNRNPFLCLREPSLGPVFGIKGGAAGGGYSQVVPMADINLHFTGDFHAITAAHNLLAALLDNHLHHNNALGIHGGVRFQIAAGKMNFAAGHVDPMVQHVTVDEVEAAVDAVVLLTVGGGVVGAAVGGGGGIRQPRPPWAACRTRRPGSRSCRRARTRPSWTR